jgi:ribosome-associated translation inhibitor RaiA
MSPVWEFEVTMAADADVPDSVRADAEEMIRRVARFASQPVIHARGSLRLSDDPAVERPAIAKASLDVSGRIVRAHVAAGEIREAVDLLERRLRRNLDDHEQLERALRSETGVAEPGEWRHADLPTARPAYFPRPPEERELVRRKTFALAVLSPEEAAGEMRILDYDFHLFTNADTGEENLVYRRDDGTVGLAQATPSPDRGPYAIAADPLPAPPMLLEDAIERLDLSGERFLFFVDAQTRRGNVLYLRYDGHYGPIEPHAG